MPVKCLSLTSKQSIVIDYKINPSIRQLAKWYGVSERTIGRVLAEANLLAPNERISQDMQKVRKIMKKYGVTVASLDYVLSQAVGMPYAA